VICCDEQKGIRKTWDAFALNLPDNGRQFGTEFG